MDQLASRHVLLELDDLNSSAKLGTRPYHTIQVKSVLCITENRRSDVPIGSFADIKIQRTKVGSAINTGHLCACPRCRQRANIGSRAMGS